MPRDNWCSQCDGMFHDDEIGERGVCIYCDTGTESGQEQKEEQGGD